MKNKNNLFGNLLILIGLILYNYVLFFVVKLMKDLMFLVIGICLTIIVVGGVSLLGKENEVEND